MNIYLYTYIYKIRGLDCIENSTLYIRLRRKTHKASVRNIDHSYRLFDTP